ncbi:ComF family protein [Ectothiorhodospiraceae bacterium WFHF3C12]|nr:ComF family protein [Ectothiorhodospiraceae bacterium WFHF3C12]
MMDRLLPQPCRFCGASGSEHRTGCCSACRADLPWAVPGCRRCALPLPGGDVCGECLADPPAFTATTVAFRYAWPVDTLVKRLKYEGRLADGALLGSLLAERLIAEGVPAPEWIVPVPLHPARLRQRGFNQAREVARALRRELGPDIAPGMLRRIRRTDSQAGLSAPGRRRNLRGAFQCNAKDTPRYVALVDDVVTTASTIRAAAACLRRAGVARVDVWAVARAA